MLLIPVFIVILMMGHSFVACVIFIAASLTDALDGHIARKYNLVTNFGKIMDPLADKLLVVSALSCMVELGQVASWMLIIILAREFAITSLRAVAAGDGIVIAAANSGKLKTILQMLAIILLLLQNYPFALFTSVRVDVIVLWAAVIMTVYSGVEYIVKNKNIFSA